MSPEEFLNEVAAVESLYPERVEHTYDQEDDVESGEAACSSKRSDSLRVVKIQTPVTVPDKLRVHVFEQSLLEEELARRFAEGTEYADSSVTHLPVPALERTVSGNRCIAIFESSGLPPIELCLIPPSEGQVLPDQKESIGFTLISSWLSISNLSRICSKLDEMAMENEGMPVLPLWIYFLEYELLEFLGIKDSVTIATDVEEESQECDPRAIADSMNTTEKLEAVIRSHVKAEKRRFMETDHECPICFDVQSGREFEVILGCKHFFCRECLMGHFESQLTKTGVLNIRCPSDGDCSTPVPLNLLEKVLPKQQFRRWEKLAFKSALENLEDAEWCPRCDLIATKNADLAGNSLCQYCSFLFCSNCRNQSHPGKSCKTLEQLKKELEDKMRSQTTQSFAEEFTAQLEKAMQRLEEEKEGLDTVWRTSKRCPTCWAPIQKNGGCNKVRCAKCGKNMCWLCQIPIQGYEHFGNAGCDLAGADDDFVQDEAEGNIAQAALPEAPGPAHPQRRGYKPPGGNYVICTTCGQRNFFGRNNHVRCGACRSNMCGVCKNKITGVVTNHFGTGKCPQHS